MIAEGKEMIIAPGDYAFRDGDSRGCITFLVGDGTEVIRCEPDGRIIIRGNHVADDLEVYEALREWVLSARVKP